MFIIIKAVFGLRVSPEVEATGIDAFYHGTTSYPEFTEGLAIASAGLHPEGAGADI